MIKSSVIAALSGVLLSPLLVSCGGGSAWDTCDGYREDVSPGSAQDTRDIENGDNPCY